MNPAGSLLIATYLKQLKMPQAARVYQAMAREAENNNLPFPRFDGHEE